MSKPRKLPFALVRFRNFLVRLLGNKMAFAGLVILLLFSGMAISAPYLTPYTPQGTIVSGTNDPPFWNPSITGDTTWSGNGDFTDLTVLPASTAIQTSSEDSVEFKATTSQSSTISVVKTVSWQFDGPPKSFTGNVKITPSGLNGPIVSATAYLGKGGVRWVLWDEQLNSSQVYAPEVGFNSQDPELADRLNIAGGFTPAQVIFSEKGSYEYVVEFVLPGGLPEVTFSVQDFQMFLFGTVFGALGTDNSGHDLFTQFAHGSQVSLEVGLLATFLGISVGLMVGLLAGYLGGLVDEVLMRFTDMMLVIPGLPLLIVLVAVLGPSLFNLIMVLGFLGWMGFARIIRSQVLSLRERPFIEAARASGAGTGYVTVKHIFPNIVSLTYVNLALSVPAAIVGEAALSFLGLGPGATSWGKMLQDASSAGTSSGNLLWWWIIPPGVGIALLSLSFILVGYALDEMFNPKLRKRR